MKTELRLVGGATEGGIVELPTEVLLPARTYQEAMRISMRMSRVKRSLESWAELLGYAHPRFSRILNCDLDSPGKDKAFLNPKKYTLFYQITGNYGLRQWFDLESRGLLNHQRMCPREERKQQLLRELELLEAS